MGSTSLTVAVGADFGLRRPRSPAPFQPTPSTRACSDTSRHGADCLASLEVKYEYAHATTTMPHSQSLSS